MRWWKNLIFSSIIKAWNKVAKEYYIVTNSGNLYKNIYIINGGITWEIVILV